MVVNRDRRTGDAALAARVCRVHAQGRRTDDGSMCTLLVIHEADSSWAIHGLGAPGVRLSKAEMIALAEKILARAR
jgi:hypothetical protein